MRATYFDTAQSTPAVAQQLDSTLASGSDEDRVLRKIIVGKPVAGASIVVYNPNNAVFGSTANIAFKYTFPTFGAGTPASDQFEFGSVAGGTKGTDGLILPGGGSFTTSSAMQVTFLWDNPDDA